MNIEEVRSRIPATGAMTYLNTGWAGPTPTPVMEAITTRLQYEGHNGPTSIEVRNSGKEISLQSKEAVAKLLNAGTKEVLLTQNTTEGLNIITNGLSWSQGDEIITFNLEHAAALMASYRVQHRWNAKVKCLDIDTDQSDDGILKRIEEAITNRTKAIIMSHIQYSCGLRMPIKKIVDLVQTKGILTLVDGAQTAGHIAVDVKDLGCDIYSIPGQKWLLGPDGTGALYIKQSMIPELIPYYTNSSSCNIDSLQGSTASTPIRAGFLEAIRFIEAIGIENIEARNLKLAASLKNKLLEIPGVTVTSPMDASQSSGLVTFTISDMVPKEFVSEIWLNSRILIRNVSYPNSIRASLDFFNTENEVSKLAGVVHAASRSNA